jgi:competence protein ComEC
MRSAAVLFFLGILTAQQLPQLPSLSYLFALPALALLAWRFPKIRFLFWFACGFCYLLWRADLILAHSLPTNLENISLQVTGKINNVPVREAHAWRFLFDIESISSAGKITPFELKTKLSWTTAPDLILHAGQRWEFYVKLKPPRSELNFGVFDYSALLFQQGIHATGRVQDKFTSRLIAEPSNWELHFQRERLAQQIIQALPQHPEASSILVALVLGVQQFIKPPQWDTIRNTGITHLIAISGTHITAITVLMFFVSRYVWAILGLSFLVPSQYIASICSVFATWAYVILAGSAVPSLRTALMISAVMLALFSKRGIRSTNIMAIALWAVLLFDPLAVMAVGFWLSFLAVGLLMYSAQAQFFHAAKNPHYQKLAVFLLPQIAISVGLFPLLWIWFGTISLASFPANLLAIPVVS